MIPADRLTGVALVAFSTIAESIGQLAFKRAADRPPNTGAGPIATIIANWRIILLGYGGFIADGLLWSAALFYLDITVAHPLGSIVFVVTAFLSRLILKEKINRRRWCGIGLIILGAALVVSH